MLQSLAIVIPTFNRKDCVATLLTQLYAQQLRDIALHVVLVVDGSTDGTQALVRSQFPLTHVVEGKDMWFTRSVNAGLRYAHAQGWQLALILNDDLEVEHTYVQTLVDAYNSVSKPCVMGSATLTFTAPRTIYFSGTERLVRWRYKSYNYHGRFAPVPGDFTGVHQTLGLPGRGMLFPMREAHDIGFFDESFPQYCSDDDFTMRMIATGYPAYISWDARVYSHVEKTGAGSGFLKQTWPQFLRSLVNPYSRSYLPAAWRMLWRHGSKPLFPVAAAIAVAGKFNSFLFAKKI